MPPINIYHGANPIEGADDTEAPCISFGEGATTTMLEMLRMFHEWTVQITAAGETFNARILDVEVDDRSIWSVSVIRWLDDECSQLADHSELVPLDQFVRVHVW